MFNDKVIYFLAIGQTLAWATIYYVFPALLLRWEADFGWSKADLTGAITMAVLISAALSPVAGKIIDRGRGAEMMAGCAALAGLGVMAISVVTEVWHFYLCWAVIGAALAGCLYEPCFALITRARGAEARKGITAVTLAAGFASTLSFPIAHAIAGAFDWQRVVLLFGATAVFIVSPLLWIGIRGLERERAAQPDAASFAKMPSKSRAFLSSSAFWCLAIGFALSALLHGAALHHLLPLLDARGVASDMAVLVASFIGPMQVAGRIAMMATEKHISSHGVALVSFAALSLSAFVLLLDGTSAFSLVVFITLFGSAYGMTSILRPVLARDILGDSDFGAKSGALALPYLAGAAIAPYLGSLLWNVGGYDLMLSVLIFTGVLGGVLYAFAHHQKTAASKVSSR